MSQQDPFYNNYTGASTTNVQPNPAPAQQFTMITQINEQSLQTIRAIVREELQNVLKGDNNNGCTQCKTAQAECDNRS